VKIEGALHKTCYSADLDNELTENKNRKCNKKRQAGYTHTGEKTSAAGFCIAPEKRVLM
jgi:hypothetical protein